MSTAHESSTLSIPLIHVRELAHSLRGRAQSESIMAESSPPGEDRVRHTGRSDAFVEAAELVERYVNERIDGAAEGN
jgi:hypothetical protein